MSDQPSAASKCTAGAQLEPTVFKKICEVALPAGESIDKRYRVAVTTFQTGTVDAAAAHLSGLALAHGNVQVGSVLCTAVAVTTIFEIVEPGADNELYVLTNFGYAAASMVCAAIVATRLG